MHILLICLFSYSPFAQYIPIEPSFVDFSRIIGQDRISQEKYASEFCLDGVSDQFETAEGEFSDNDEPTKNQLDQIRQSEELEMKCRAEHDLNPLGDENHELHGGALSDWGYNCMEQAESVVTDPVKWKDFD